MNYNKLYILSLFFCSCSTNESIVGLYGKCGDGYLACTQIEFKSDKTFEYYIFMDVGGGTITKGNWEHVSKDSIKLNTFEQPKNPSTTYKGRMNPERPDVLKIKIADYERPLADSYIVLNNQNEGKEADVNGTIEIKAQEVKTITYYYLGRKETIKVENPNFNEIEISVRDLDLDPISKYMTDLKLKVNKRKIIFDDGYLLKKTKLKYKQWK